MSLFNKMFIASIAGGGAIGIVCVGLAYAKVIPEWSAFVMAVILSAAFGRIVGRYTARKFRGK